MKFMFLVLFLAMPMAAQSESLLAAIRHVESGGNDLAVGDGGKAIGPYQIHRIYWTDAVSFDRSIKGRYEDCYDPAYAAKVVKAYLKRYAPAGASNEVMARIHNGGPKGATKTATKAYWAKIAKQLKAR